MKLALYVAMLALLQASLVAQSSDNELPFAGGKFVQAIEDNSFFIEEAFNQESGIVQHISTLSFFSKPVTNASFGFTQEWPLGGQAHQFSFTIPYLWVDGNAVAGAGDVLLNYRYQLYDAEDWAAVSPRISLVIPVGSKSKGLGDGVFGVQFNLPVSKRLSNFFVAHVNAGATILPNVTAPALSGGEVKRTLTAYNLGGSVIALVTPKLNLMLELSTTFFGEIDGRGELVRASETIFSPGVRGAIDIGALQVVPGIALPVSITGAEARTGAFFYLSFEHPF